MSIPITLSDFIQALLRVIPIQPGVVEISNHKLSIWRVSKLCAVVVFFAHVLLRYSCKLYTANSYQVNVYL